MWRGGVGWHIRWPTLSVAGVSLAIPCSVSTSRSSNLPAGRQAGRAIFPHPAFGQGLTLSPTADVASAKTAPPTPASCRGIGPGKGCLCENSRTLAGVVARQRLRLTWGRDGEFVLAGRAANAPLLLNRRKIKTPAAFRTVHMRRSLPLSLQSVFR